MNRPNLRRKRSSEAERPVAGKLVRCVAQGLFDRLSVLCGD